jgi:SAM-dependent methyltransferase
MKAAQPNSHWRNLSQVTQFAVSPDREIQEQFLPLTSSIAACPNFDRLARAYRWMEWFSFGPFLHWCRCAGLDRLRDRTRALVFGDGDGRFTARFLRANSGAAVDAIDASPAMLRSLFRRAGPNAVRVRAHAADAREWQPHGTGYDLVVTHFFLDCLTNDEVHALATKLRVALTKDALWLVSEFAVPQNAFGRFVASPIVALLYRAFGWLTGLGVRRLPDHANALRSAGFALVARRTWLFGLLASELWSATPPSEAQLTCSRRSAAAAP